MLVSTDFYLHNMNVYIKLWLTMYLVFVGFIYHDLFQSFFSPTKSVVSWKNLQHKRHRFTLQCWHNITIFFLQIFESVAHVCSWHLTGLVVSESTGQCVTSVSNQHLKNPLTGSNVLSVNPTQRFFETGTIWVNLVSLGLSLDMIGLSTSSLAVNSIAVFELTVDALDLRCKKYSSG